MRTEQLWVSWFILPILLISSTNPHDFPTGSLVIQIRCPFLCLWAPHSTCTMYLLNSLSDCTSLFLDLLDIDLHLVSVHAAAKVYPAGLLPATTLTGFPGCWLLSLPWHTDSRRFSFSFHLSFHLWPAPMHDWPQREDSWHALFWDSLYRPRKMLPVKAL